MTRIHAYLNFNGNCEDAFRFYETVFKKPNIGIHRFGDIPENPEFKMADADKNKVMHTAIMINDNTMLMGSDCIEGFGHKAVEGTNTYIMLDTSSAAEATELYHALSKDAKIIEMPLGEQFFAEVYASFTDKFGIPWMIHFEGNKGQHNA
ncbi:VOC family protein [Gynurincola endophyticus]|jgi:PhnB protein|uniref:VOC family protein n=1 Tax=Gynurincola endophyticus TaxID=2479004 RepID=UPI000F8DDD86|nr:VOC family protein [Gynurincola endophyticus]